MSDLDDLGALLQTEKLKSYFKDHTYLVLLILVFFFALSIRLIPLENIKHLQALDPYMISRISLKVAETGSMPQVDVLRYFPYTTPLYLHNLGDIFIPAYLFNIVNFFTGIDFLTWGQIWPAIFGALLAVIMYFIGSEAFDKKSGLLAAFFLASSSAVLHRSSAGWFEKEALGTFFILTSLYFLIRAWKRKSWVSGIISGITLALATISWGGGELLFLLYPLTGLAVLLLNEDVEKLIVAYTPTIILGNFLAASLNSARWSVASNTALAGWGLLGLIWLRYLAEELELMDEKHLAFLPSATVLLGLLGLALSPLYYQPLASKFSGLLRIALRSGGGVIINTVAESTPASGGRIIGKLGAAAAAGKLPGFMAPFTELFSGWTLSLIGAGVLTTITALMLLRKFGIYHQTSDKKLYVLILAGTLVVSSIFIYLLPGAPVSAFLPAVGLLLIGIIAFGSKGSSLELRSFQFHGYYLLILFWYLSTIFATSQQNRILFLASFPTALVAGYATGKALQELSRSVSIAKLDKVIDERFADLGDIRVKKGFWLVALLFLGLIVIYNASAASYVAERNIGGSPNSAWLENLNYMRKETPKDSVILSWWDYGYWFETIGKRAAIADGGNLGFYRNGYDEKINYPLADFLASSNYTNYPNWLRAFSVDYIVLDHTMIGKYSAVSQIHNKDNRNFNSMLTLSTNNNIRNSLKQIESENKTVVSFKGRNLEVLLPISLGQKNIGIDGAPRLRTGRGQIKLPCMLTEDKGKIKFEEGNEGGRFCLALSPYFTLERSLAFAQRGGGMAARAVLVPRQIEDSTLVRLYLTNAHGMKHFEPVPGGSNDYVRMWKVNYKAG